MTLIGRARIGSPLFQSALEAVPEMVLEFEDVRREQGERRRFVLWASGNDFEAFEAALDADPTVGAHQCLTDLGDRRLYRFTLSEEGQRASQYSTVVREDIVLLDLTIKEGALLAVARIPSREALAAIREAYQEHGIPFHLLQLYTEETTATDDDSDRRFGATNAQREALLHALEAGYFAVPRETTLEEMADELGISTSAFSLRLRRGQENLLRGTLAQ